MCPVRETLNQDALEFWKHSDDMHGLHGVLISAKTTRVRDLEIVLIEGTLNNIS